MKQQILSSHIPLCDRHMVIATTLLGGRGGYSKVNMQFSNMAGILFTKNVNNIFSWCSLCATWKQKSYTLQTYVEGVLSILGGSSCMVKMCPKLPLHGTAKKKSFWGGPKTQEPEIL